MAVEAEEGAGRAGSRTLGVNGLDRLEHGDD
jgi:hypothetical protein